MGRVAELEEVNELLNAHRLVTLVGPGGVGKSRLAVEAAARAAVADPVDCWLVELAPLDDPAHVETAAASVLGIDDPARLESFLADRRALIVLDNCEHLIDAAAAIASRLLHAGPGIKVLATSREVLGVAGERRWVVPPLTTADASALFVERAAEGGGSVEGERALVEGICERLDGLPLAVELAAARTRTLSLGDIATRIDDRFRLLTGGDRTAQPRQQTLRGVVDWSYDLLFSDEQRVLRRLSVFTGGFGLRGRGAGDVRRRRRPRGRDRPRRPSGRQVARRGHRPQRRDAGTSCSRPSWTTDARSSSAADEVDATRDRHLAWILELATEAEPQLRGPAQADWTVVLETERDNIRTAVEWAMAQGRIGDAVAIVAALAYGWYISGAVNEGRILLETVLAIDDVSSAEHRAIAHAWAAWLTQFGSGASEPVVAHAERAVDLARGTSSRSFAIAAGLASMLRAFRGLTDSAAQLMDEAAAVLEDRPDPWGQAWVDWVRSGLTLKMGDRDARSTLLRRSFAEFETVGDGWGAAIASIRLSELAEARGDYDEARTHATSAYEAVMLVGPRTFNASMLATRLGNLSALQGRFDEAREWHDTALVHAREGCLRRRGGPDPQRHGPCRVPGGASGRGRVPAPRSAGRLREVGVGGRHRRLARRARASSPRRAAMTRRPSTCTCEACARRLAATIVGPLRWPSKGLAGARANQGDGQRAAVLLGAAAEIRRHAGGPLPSAQDPDTSHTAERVGALLGPAELAAAQGAGAEACDGIVDQLLSEADLHVS